jgi:enoyl-CoA hydratase/carnithine racemase
MTEQPILTRTDGRVAWIEINRPHARNAIDTATRSALDDAFAAASRDVEIRVVVIRGLHGAFSAGVDLKEVREPAGNHPFTDSSEPLVGSLVACSKPVIAAIDGPAVGGGFELALAAEMRVATPRSTFALTEARIGSLPASGGTQRLFAAIPSAVAWKLLLTGEKLDAQRAYDLGLVSDLIEEQDFESKVSDIANRVAGAAPLSLRALKVAGNAGAAGSGTAGLALERSLWAFLATTEDRNEGRLAFREKRDPDFKGR